MKHKEQREKVIKYVRVQDNIKYILKQIERENGQKKMRKQCLIIHESKQTKDLRSSGKLKQDK